MKKIVQTKNKSSISKIKIQIIWNFVFSFIWAFIISCMCFAIVLVGLEYLWKEKYLEIINQYNNSTLGQAVFMLAFIALFLTCAFLIFLHKMDPITEAINKLSLRINEIANGKFDGKVEINQKNELGNLACDLDTMAIKLNEAVEKEKQWNLERYNMITNMSHDLKTPMVSIMGYVDFIANRKYVTEEERNTYCAIVERKTKELNEHINQLFQLAKISSYDYKIEKRHILIREFTEQVLMEYIPEFEENRMEYRIDISPELDILADADSLKRIYENIISNAIKYAADGKYLDISATKTMNGRRIVFQNYGKKIEDSEQLQIFEKFYREKSNSGKEGSGCGLYIVKKIVDLHDGSILINSSDQCTQFVVELP